jgi:hypothetical protein
MASVMLSEAQRDAMKLDAASLPVGESRGDLPCPVCGVAGSFGIKRAPEGILYNCFRVKCGIQGFVPMTGGFTYSGDANHKKEQKMNPYRGELYELPKTIKQWIYAKYGISENVVDRQGWRYDAAKHRLVMSGYSYFGYEFVQVAKKLPQSDYTGPKAVNYFNHADPIKLAYPRPHQDYVESDTLVLVEDLISAVKVGTFMNCAALLGTGLNNQQVAFLAAHYRQIIMMLDPDALNKSLYYSKQYGSLFDKFGVSYLMKDPKDTPYYQLEASVLGLS